MVSSAVLIGGGGYIISSIDDSTYYITYLETIAAFCITVLTGINLFCELIYFTTRFLNAHCYNNHYKVYGTLVRSRYMCICGHCHLSDVIVMCRLLSDTFYLDCACCLVLLYTLRELGMPKVGLAIVITDQN